MTPLLVEHQAQIWNGQGLTVKEVSLRRSAGQVNNIALPTSRTYSEILRENLLTFINAVFLTISLVMFLLERYGDSFLVIIVIFGGVLVNIGQEIWAKRKLDRIALLNQLRASVIRDGQTQSIAPEDIVQGDILLVKPGDQIVVDGLILQGSQIEVDESLLTGESEPILKVAGESVYSGSFCLSGTAWYEAQKVGTQTLAYQLMTGARAFRQSLTPLQREVNLVIRIFFLIACFLWFSVGINFLLNSGSLNEIAQKAAVIAGLVPSGLLLGITLAYGLAAVRMLEKNVLIQQINAVESLSNVDVLCLDKTGTLTTNQLHLQSVHSVGISEVELRKILGVYAASTSSSNKTIEAIASACSGQKLQPIVEIPFSSARGWSALAFESDRESELRQGIYILGAPERLTPVLNLSVETTDLIDKAAEKGLRVVLFTYHSNLEALPNERNSFQLPFNLTLLGILVFGDHLRPQAREILLDFIKAGIEIKIISGDSSKTVAALARQLGLNSALKVTSGLELARMDEEEFIQTARVSQIFGRITPGQKAKLIQSCRQQGSYVAMIGDGVNDVLSLKQANLAIAMESGSQATRSAADLVLLKDSFAALPHIFLEGQRIRNSIHDMMKLFMVRTLCITLLIFTTAIVTGTFPLANKQSALIALIGVGFPTFVIPAWAKSGKRSQSNLVRSILHFVLPATLTLALVSFVIYLLYWMVSVFHLPLNLELGQVDYKIPQSALVTILILGELLLLPFLKPPTGAWVGGEVLSSDWRYSILALLLLSLYGVILLVPPLYQFFELAQLSTISYLFIGLVALVWCLLLRWLWRFRLLDRLLGVDL